MLKEYPIFSEIYVLYSQEDRRNVLNLIPRNGEGLVHKFGHKCFLVGFSIITINSLDQVVVTYQKREKVNEEIA